jgi:peptide deformylase
MTEEEMAKESGAPAAAGTSPAAEDTDAGSEDATHEVDPARLERRDAALAQVVKFGDPVLRSVASPVQEFARFLAEDVERMSDLMQEGMGVGLAATQLGILRRILVFQAGADAPVTALINPEIEWSSEENRATAEEGCLSLPGVVVDVERPLRIRVSAVDPGGEPLRIEAVGLEARVIQHEVDHLDGVLMLQHAPKDQRRAALKALREGGTYAPDREPTEGDADEAEPSSVA